MLIPEAMMGPYDSPKRKRSTPPFQSLAGDAPDSSRVQVVIPQPPPTSSPSQTETEPDMRHATSMNGVEVVVPEENTGSPRTKVAYHFQGLQLEDGGDVSKLSLDQQRADAPKPVSRSDAHFGVDGTEESIVRKRMRFLESSSGGSRSLGSRELEIPETPEAKGSQFGITFGPERTIDPFIEEKAKQLVLHNEVDPVIFKGKSKSKAKGAGLARAYPSINRLSDSKSRGKGKRAGTPPLFGSADASIEMAKEKGIVDAERAALTWHDDEITGHDPQDPDDDGEGINGIGFRPTAAEAYQRAQRRKQQMADYKSREAREARARRNERRRGTGSESLEEREAARRVRFMEAEKSNVFMIG